LSLNCADSGTRSDSKSDRITMQGIQFSPEEEIGREEPPLGFLP
jgi:hypothetical protein